MSIRFSRPKRALRFALRLPIYLYHAHLGFLLDHRFMLLTHRGRKSGRLHETVLEVVVYDRASRTSYVLSGWGTAADWYRNIEAQPPVRVQVGTDDYAPVHHFLATEEATAVWTAFRRKHPLEEQIALRLFSRPGKKYASPRERRADLLAEMHMVSFHPPKEQ
jgi:deazaflavin-dependent oxidoreductase (nitroreductase family)